MQYDADTGTLNNPVQRARDTLMNSFHLPAYEAYGHAYVDAENRYRDLVDGPEVALRTLADLKGHEARAEAEHQTERLVAGYCERNPALSVLLSSEINKILWNRGDSPEHETVSSWRDVATMHADPTVYTDRLLQIFNDPAEAFSLLQQQVMKTEVAEGALAQRAVDAWEDPEARWDACMLYGEVVWGNRFIAMNNFFPMLSLTDRKGPILGRMATSTPAASHGNAGSDERPDESDKSGHNGQRQSPTRSFGMPPPQSVWKPIILPESALSRDDKDRQPAHMAAPRQARLPKFLGELAARTRNTRAPLGELRPAHG